MDDQLTELTKKMEKMQYDIDVLQKKRIYQQDIVPAVVKNRHLGEANTYIYNGQSAYLPTTGNSVTIGTQVFYAEDEKKLYIWNSTNEAWDVVQFS